MNESKEYSSLLIEDICRVCLKRTNELYTMSENIETFYRSCVDVVANEYNMKMCILCKWMLFKLQKFKLQCQMANDLLKDFIYIDTKEQVLKEFTINLTLKRLHTFSYNVTTDDTNCKLNDNYNSTNNKIIYDVSHNDKGNSFNTNEVKNENDNEYDSYNNEFDSADNHFDSCNDEIPLLFLKNVEQKGKKVKKNLLQEKVSEMSSKVRCKNKKKVLKEGFTSRMVQETEEYTVIKLTKEQVLKEMEERSRSDSYLRSPFKCGDCVKGFNFDDVLQTHMEKHTMKNGSFLCDMCQQYCPSAVSLRGHIKSHTTRYKCKLCDNVRLSRQHLLEHHAISHTDAATNYHCDYCKFTTNKRTIMQRHVRRHVSSESHACHKCGKLFKTIESLRLHTVRHDKSSRHVCGACGASFVYVSQLRKHEQFVHKSREYYCVECDVQFISSESLRLHFKKAKKHRDPTASKYKPPQSDRTHPCPSCDRHYSSADALRAHKWRAHKKCAVCGNRKNEQDPNACCRQNPLDNERKERYASKIEE